MTTAEWVPHEPTTWPYRFGVLKEDTPFSQYLGYWKKGEPAMREWVAPAGTKVKIVMASRFGDVGITDNLTAEHGYAARVTLDKLSDLAATP